MSRSELGTTGSLESRVGTDILNGNGMFLEVDGPEETTLEEDGDLGQSVAGVEAMF